ncbi:MAG TPA: DedA family protein [Aeromonadales bacterium]|nr:DedA family protein [Aeromonadales bacterium]
MKIFTHLYDKVLKWSEHPLAVRYLCVMSFSESVFFPVPTDVMLAPMVLSKPDRAWFLAMITTITSVSGGIVGYYLGYYLFESFLQPHLINWGYQALYQQTYRWFAEYGIWVVFIAGFSPVPYKIFTITAGVMQLALIPFILISLISRAGRFFLVAALMRWGGASMKEKLRDYIDTIGWTVVVIIVGYLSYRLLM